jgi:PIN domain nuclease of toxin-antitoxin system
MRLLLDTHILLWSTLSPERLPDQLKQALKLRENELWLSPISVWECVMLVERGRIVLAERAEPWVRRVIEEVGLIEAPLNKEVALLSRTVRLEHQDPADRFLAATAVVYDLTLVTADDRLLRCSDYPVISAC